LFPTLPATASGKVFSVKEITTLIKRTLESTFPQIWVEGEISNFKRTTAGHVYFTLKDDASQISVVMFRFNALRCIKEDIQNGVKVRVFGDISLYEKSGQYQINATGLEKMGVGDLQIRFLKLKEKLHQAGWFDPARKRSIPLLPERIGIVTSPTGAAIRDMLEIIFKRCPNSRVLLFPVKVQGDNAAAEISEAIRILNAEASVSVIIIGRGGGSLEDLWAFNEEIVARAIFESVIPVISGVGHEIDFTIADFVSDFRAETPSAAAMKVVPVQSELLDSLTRMKTSLHQSIHGKVIRLQEKVKLLKSHYAFRTPLHHIQTYYQKLDEMAQALCKSVDSFLSLKKEKTKNLASLLNSLSPYRILDRGYALVTDSETGVFIKSVGDANKSLTTLVKDGKIFSQVIRIKKTTNCFKDPTQ